MKIDFLKQKMMRKVMISLIPIIFFSYYLFGIKVLILLFLSNILALLTEYIMLKNIDKDKVKISEAVFITSALYTLSLPPTIPYWVAGVGIVFGMLFGKMVFGGFGKNIFNPALLGRCFIYISFPSFMTSSWIKPFSGFPGGLLKYSNSTDALTSVTPLISKNEEFLDILIGNISGSLGETSAVLIIFAGIYLIYTKTASWKIITSTLLSFIFFSFIFYLTGAVDTSPEYMLFTGGIMFAAVFMATDPISAPKQEAAKIIYGILIGAIAVIIRTYSVFTEGIMFAILISNTFVSLIDMKVKAYKEKKKVSA